MNEHLNEGDREKLRLENQIRKIKLSLEKGAKFIEDPKMPELPPELEYEFLNYIEQFEKININESQISVFDKIGKPAYRKVNTIPDEEILAELDAMFLLLNQHGIAVETIYFVEPREIYRFITEDIFKVELFDLLELKGLVTQFIYEEFYPNDEENIKQKADDFIQALFNRENEDYQELISKQYDHWFEHFRNVYTFFKLKSFEILEIKRTRNEIELFFDIDFQAFLDERQTHQFKGGGIIYFNDDDFRTIKKIKFPKAM